MAALSCGTSWMGFPLKYVELFRLSTCQNYSCLTDGRMWVSAAVATNGHKSVWDELFCRNRSLMKPSVHGSDRSGTWCECHCRNSWWCRTFWARRWDKLCLWCRLWYWLCRLLRFSVQCSPSEGGAAVCDVPIGRDTVDWERGPSCALELPISAKQREALSSRWAFCFVLGVTHPQAFR